MRKSGIDSREIAEAVRRLNELPGYLTRDVKALLKYAAEPTLDAAKRYAPDTKSQKVVAWTPKGFRRIPAGDLKRSLSFLSFSKSGRTTVFIGPALRARRQKTGIVGTYATKLEFGAQGQSAQPYMRPAFDTTKAIVVERLGRALERKIKPWQTKYQRLK